MKKLGGGDANQGMYGSRMGFSGLMVYDATVQNGFSLKGKVAHPNASSSAYGYYESGGCYNWWTNATSEVKRSIIMDDYVFSVSNRRIKVNRLDALANDVRDIDRVSVRQAACRGGACGNTSSYALAAA